MLSAAEQAELTALRLREARLAEIERQLREATGPVALSQSDLAVLHNTTRYEIRQLEARALLKARRALIALQTTNPTHQP